MALYLDGVFRPHVDGELLLAIAERARRGVSALRDQRAASIAAEGPGRGTMRMLSMREMGDMLGVSGTTVKRKLHDVESAPGRVYGYDLDAYIEVRMALRKMPGRLREPVYVAIANFKGGVSKSTLTAHLGWALALQGYRVLMVDLDPQGTLSAYFGRNPDMGLADQTIVPYLAGDRPDLEYARVPTEVRTLQLIPANLALNEADLLLPARQAKSRAQDWFYGDALRNGLDGLRDRPDVVLMDCPPSLSYLTTLGVRAADVVLVPMRPSMPDLASSVSFLEMFGATLDDMDAALGPVSGPKRYADVKIVITQSRRRHAHQEEDAIEDMEGAIRAIYGGLVLSHGFPHMAAIENAGAVMRTVYDVSLDDVPRRAQMGARTLLDGLVSEVEGIITSASEWKKEMRA